MFYKIICTYTFILREFGVNSSVLLSFWLRLLDHDYWRVCVCVLLDVCCRDEPQSRLSKMGAMPTPFQSAPDDFPPPPPEVEEEPELKDAPGITWRSECSRFEIKSLDLWKSQEKSEILRIILLTAPVALPAPKISVPPKMKALPKVPLKPSAEDLELYGWVRVSGALICLQ